MIKSLQQALQWKDNFLAKNRVYKGGLELEEQKEVISDNNKICYEFAGTIVTIEKTGKNLHSFYCKTWNKNEEYLLKYGKQCRLGIFQKSVWYLIIINGECR